MNYVQTDILGALMLALFVRYYFTQICLCQISFYSGKGKVVKKGFYVCYEK